MPTKRPFMVWLIAIFYGFSALSSLMTYGMLFAGKIPLTGVQAQYFENLLAVDRVILVSVNAMVLLGSVYLIMMRRWAFWFFAISLGVDLSFALWQSSTSPWLKMLGWEGLVGLTVDWLIRFGVCLYLWNMRERQLLV